MKCPHCETGIFTEPGDKYFEEIEIGSTDDKYFIWTLEYTQCPVCYKFIIYMATLIDFDDKKREMIYPKKNPYPNCPKEVPNDIAQEYTEACLILPVSPTASAAISRRCLQHFLREVVKVKSGNLIDEIKDIINTGKLPSYISEDLDAVRRIGNFAAHPIKNEQTGTILPVEPGEAEWNIKILYALFDFYCVEPDKSRKRRDELNQKQKLTKKQNT